MSLDMKSRKYGNRRGPYHDVRDKEAINDLWFNIDKIQQLYKISLPDFFPKKKFDLRDFPRNMSADAKGWKLMEFTLNTTRVAIGIIEDAKNNMDFNVTERNLVYPNTKIVAIESFMKHKNIAQRKVSVLYTEKLKNQVEFIQKFVLQHHFTKNNVNNRTNR